jgi:hypothetical protein
MPATASAKLPALSISWRATRMWQATLLVSSEQSRPGSCWKVR